MSLSSKDGTVETITQMWLRKVKEEWRAEERERIRDAVKAAPVLVLPTGTYVDVEYVFDAIDPEADR